MYGTYTKELHKTNNSRRAASLVRLNKVLALDSESGGNQILPCRQRSRGSEEQATDNRCRHYDPKREKYFPEQSPHSRLVLFHLRLRGIDVPDTPNGLDPFLSRRVRAQFAANLDHVSVNVSIERREFPSASL